MASVIDLGDGRRAIQIAIGDKRPTIKLGKVSKPDALIVKTHLERLANAARLGTAIPDATAAWVGVVADDLRERLEAVGLLPRRGPAAAVAESPTLGDFTRAWIDRRRGELGDGTVSVYEQGRLAVIAALGRDTPIAALTAASAHDFRTHLKKAGLAESTIKRRCRSVRTMLEYAVDSELLTVNPFRVLKRLSIGGDPAGLHTWTVAEISRLLDATADPEWRAIIVLARFGALRIPSELVPLTWRHVNWAAGTLTIPSPKTAHAGKAERVIPLFKEIEAALLELFEGRDSDDAPVITRYPCTKMNLRTQLGRLCRRAGLPIIPRPWRSMRMTRANELVRTFPAVAVTAWCGHTRAVADAHYWRVEQADFDAAVALPSALQNRVQPGAILSVSELPRETGPESELAVSAVGTTPCDSVSFKPNSDKDIRRFRRDSNTHENCRSDGGGAAKSCAIGPETAGLSPDDRELSELLRLWAGLSPGQRGGLLSLARHFADGGADARFDDAAAELGSIELIAARWRTAEAERAGGASPDGTGRTPGKPRRK